MMDLLESRISSLKRRAESLPRELEDWLQRAEAGGQFERNWSQLEALELFMRQVCTRLAEKTTALAAASASPPDLLAQSQAVHSAIVKSQALWGFFRARLEQRFLPFYAGALTVADLVLHDCYQAARAGAAALGVDHTLGLRGYPLACFTEEYESPVTWPRGARPGRLETARLPLPIIGIPWDHAASPWELVSLHHEVSHDIDIDLHQPSVETGALLETRLLQAGAPKTRAADWKRWSGEIFADFLGILLGGPPFVPFLAGFVTLPAGFVCGLNPRDPHPVPYLRVLLDAAFAAHTAGPAAQEYLEGLVERWQALYGAAPDGLSGYPADFPLVIDTFLNAPLQALAGPGGPQPLNRLMRFGEAEFSAQCAAAETFLAGGQPLAGVPVRHLPGAALIAAEQRPGDEAFAARLAEALGQAITARAPKGQLALRAERSRQFLAGLADAFIETSNDPDGDAHDPPLP